MPGLLGILRVEEAGRVWIGQPGRTYSRLMMEGGRDRGAERKARTVTREMTDHQSSRMRVIPQKDKVYVTSHQTNFQGWKEIRTSGYVNFPDLRGWIYGRSRRIFHLTRVQTHFRTHLKQSISPINSAVRQYDGVVLDVALGVVCVRQVASKIVQLR